MLPKRLERSYSQMAGRIEVESPNPGGRRWSMPQSRGMISFRDKGEFYQCRRGDLPGLIGEGGVYKINHVFEGGFYTDQVTGRTILDYLSQKRRFEIISGLIIRRRKDQSFPYAAHQRKVSGLSKKEITATQAEVFSEGQEREDREGSDLTKGLCGWKRRDK